MNERYPTSELTPEQSADVIRYYHAGENDASRKSGWKDKIALGRSAIHTTKTSETILPEGGSVLTSAEMGRGLAHITGAAGEAKVVSMARNIDDSIEDLVDKRGFSYDAARRVIGLDTLVE